MERRRRETRVVVVGAGFAGAALIRSLPQRLRRPGEVLLVDRASEFEFAPLIHEVAVGRLHPRSVVSKIPPLCTDRCAFLQAAATGLDPEEKVLHTTSGEVRYEYLALATGSVAAPPPADLAPHFRSFWSLEDAVSLRDAVSKMWRERSLPTIAIAGGGTTGVELASEMAALLRYLRRRTALRKQVPKVILLEATERLMGWLSPHFHDAAMKELRKLGVEVRLNAPVTEAAPDGVRAGGVWFPAGIRLWTAGHVISDLAAGLPGERDSSGRVRVGPRLTLPDHPEVYLLGDAAVYTDPRLGPLPPTASVAVQQGPFCARDLGRRVRNPQSKRPKFDFFDRGYVVSLGPGNAVAGALGAKFTGRAAHALFRSVLLYYLKDRGGRALTAADWAMERMGRLGF
ncbi:MAG: NAD(P)/FAD-dependent oxidoreductase [Rubrobacteraceae bacterium]